MLNIRLSQVGKKNKKMFRLVISEKARDPFGKALEILGSYNPYTKDLQSKNDRILHWISQGATLSATVNNLLINKGVIKGEKADAVKVTKRRQEKLNKKKDDDKKVVEAKAAAAAKEAAKEAAAAPAEAEAEVEATTETTEKAE